MTWQSLLLAVMLLVASWSLIALFLLSLAGRI